MTPTLWQRFTWRTLALLPLSLLYRIGVWCDRETTTPLAAPLPILSIGNATVGGTGKTPTTIALLSFCRTLGFTPHILTRGYKSAMPLHAHRVTETDTATTVGDEAMLLARHAPTWVGRDRLAAAKAAHRAGATLALCDDAHQHYRLQKTLSLLVIDGPYGFGNGLLLPAGPLREPLHHAFARADAIVLIGEDMHQLAARLPLPVFRARLTPTLAPEALAGTPLFAFAGIGRPQKFYDTLTAMGATPLATRDFPDHHAYTQEECDALLRDAAALGATLITTEKDAVKLPPALQAQVKVLPITLTFEAPDALRLFLQAQLA